MMLISYIITLLPIVATSALAKTHTFNWTTGWDYQNVDGVLNRPVITCNGQWPWPDIRVTKGDRIQVYLTNGFNDSDTSLHFHGLFQKDNNKMDGVPFLTQCPIGPGDTYLYNFTVEDNVGTYWYHSHTAGQYEDGFRGMLIIEDGEDNVNFPYEYDYDVPLGIGDWYDRTVDLLTADFMNLYNPTGAEPIPQNLILNNTRNLTWNVQPDTTYLLRIVNIGGFVSQYFWIEDHDMTVVEVDGVYTEKNTTNMLYLTVAQRYSVLIHTKNDTSKNFAIMQKFDDTMLDLIPKHLELNSTSYMVYNSSAPLPDENFVDSLDEYLDDFYLVPYEKVELFDEPDYRITLDVKMDNLINGINYAFFNNITYVTPKVPALISVLTSGNDSTNALVYGTNTNSFVLKKDEIVDIVVNNYDTGKHPFHLHGHVFQTISRDRPYEADDGETVHPFDLTDHTPYPDYPMMRDTIYLNPQSSFVIRFKADNPGVWFFHCHIEWHLIQGLAIVLIEDPENIQAVESQNFTANELNVCKNKNIPVSGNAAGDSVDFLNLKDELVQPKAIPDGFTKKGIIAMVFSCLCGVLGLIMLSVYGLMDISDVEEKVVKDFRLSPEILLDDKNMDHNESYQESVMEKSGSKSKFFTSIRRLAPL
ncbi:ferroxidase FET3 NDAI_0G04650 [Naumovozyma dairenensis CBS 421]|uniref:Iron transport multicopper oxidase FET3 n=1 Tax=Naumovozyma dairenensis (strain ATCC 10597 / BCRC 20456 / CBS 421 / NBRC 0211 / NRRL Y-12639) TaxID=1071378 RepID=J7SBP3_NAUDC|nr:hypothetical protein NDAI_0G04650 [Naumovozyma dairenensis CBS 421]CCK73450.1 hypothetical protein NDAI_0G04650 [Naumovozyma dairenensis CBS 421]